MRSIKMLGLAAVAAMVAMAFVGASSATAAEHEEIVLCEKAELVCTSPYANPTEIHAENKGLVTLLSSIATVHCPKSLAIVTLLNELAALGEGHLLALTFEECYRLKLFGGKEACNVTVNETGGLSLIPGATKLTAEATSIELAGKNTNATVVCGSIINCTYEASSETELGVSTNEAGELSLKANATPLKGTGGLCPETSKWDATYTAVNLDEGLTAKTGLYIEL